ncbi:c-type cytochrome [Ferruginibacter albus]|uniref:c-type cytochrome n=1 Tax=Ferruginibacter albus TaxID=2875540 RepID=UPI001CC49E3F|nr:cytochrome c [Ferruginibacter albus]UAY53459.1 cytochrome c [Ferruginibacter albus]
MKSFLTLLCITAIIIVLSNCSEKTPETKETVTPAVIPTYGGFETKIKWGEHLVQVGGCNDCHTPKKMTTMGPVMDTSLWLSGHPEHMPIPDVDRKEAETKGWGLTNTETAWVGPWGVSFAANLTPDSTTGIGAWTLDNFKVAIREGKKSGAPAGRSLLPPMPWPWYKYLTDDELDAMFTYLQTVKPIHNNVPAALPPVLAMPH